MTQHYVYKASERFAYAMKRDPHHKIANITLQ